MTTRNFLVALAALAVAMVIGGTIAFVAFNTGKSNTAGTGTPPGPSVTTTVPRPPVTVTKPNPPAPEPPRVYSNEDQAFLDQIASDGIKAPSDWAIDAGRKTCGINYSDAFNYLTDGGIYDYHVQTFLNDWIATHGGC